MNKISSSLESIEEEISPISIMRDINYSLQQGESITLPEWTIPTLNNPLSSFPTGINNCPLGIKLSPSLNSSISSSSCNFAQGSEIELKKNKLLQKYRNSQAKKENPKIFKNKLKMIINKRLQTSSTQNLSYLKPLSQPISKRSKSFNSTKNNPTDFLSFIRKQIKNTKKEERKKSIQGEVLQDQECLNTLLKKKNQKKTLATILLFLLGFIISKIIDLLSQVQQLCQQIKQNKIPF